METIEFRVLRCATRGIDAVVARSARTLSRHSHEQFGIGAMRSGAHRSLSGRGQVEAGAGDAITVNPGEVHDGAPIGEGTRAWSMLYLDPLIVQHAAEDVFGAHVGQFEYCRPVIGDARVSMAFWALFRIETGLGDAIEGEEKLLILTALAGRCARRPTGGPAPVISLAKQRIDDDPARPAPLQELAILAGVSRFQLIRGFTECTGLTPHAYLVQRRTDQARQLIDSGVPLADAAAAAGFADQSHMTRTFKAKYGFSPGRYAAARL